MFSNRQSTNDCWPLSQITLSENPGKTDHLDEHTTPVTVGFSKQVLPCLLVQMRKSRAKVSPGDLGMAMAAAMGQPSEPIAKAKGRRPAKDLHNHNDASNGQVNCVVPAAEDDSFTVHPTFSHEGDHFAQRGDTRGATLSQVEFRMEPRERQVIRGRNQGLLCGCVTMDPCMMTLHREVAGKRRVRDG